MQSLRVVYEVIKEIIASEENGCYVAYGIICKDEISGKIIDKISDISTREDFVLDIANRCTQGKLHPIHIRDAIYDMLP